MEFIVCKNCGSCSKEHEKTVDDSIDEVLDSEVL